MMLDGLAMFSSWKIQLKWMRTGGSTTSGNLQLGMFGSYFLTRSFKQNHCLHPIYHRYLRIERSKTGNFGLFIHHELECLKECFELMMAQSLQKCAKHSGPCRWFGPYSHSKDLEKVVQDDVERAHHQPDFLGLR